MRSLRVSAATWCTCTPNGTTVSCGSVRNTYDLPIQYVQVNTEATVNITLTYQTGLPFSGLSTVKVGTTAQGTILY